MWRLSIGTCVSAAEVPPGEVRGPRPTTPYPPQRSNAAVSTASGGENPRRLWLSRTKAAGGPGVLLRGLRADLPRSDSLALSCRAGVGGGGARDTRWGLSCPASGGGLEGRVFPDRRTGRTHCSSVEPHPAPPHTPSMRTQAATALSLHQPD